jgi:hypothetical protein
MTDKTPNLQKLLHQNQSDTTLEVKAVAFYYPELIKVYEPNIPMHKNLLDWELDKKTNINTLKAETQPFAESSIERSIRRSKKNITDYMLCNRFDIFSTITIGSDRYDIEHSKNKLNNWLKNQRDRNGKFKYLIVPEYHKDGALHFHGVFGNYTGKLKQSINAKTGKPITSKHKPVYELEEYKSGFTKVQYIGQTTEDRYKVGGYIRKYITKDMVSIFGKKRYWASTGLDKPVQEDNPQWYLETKADSEFTNDYGTIYTYTNLENKILPEYIRRLTEPKEQ